MPQPTPPPIAPVALSGSPMTAASDAELLQQFAKNGDQGAFTQLVARHINLVYSTAIRRLSGDAHLAQDVTQAVFNDAARKARALANYRLLSSWLYTSTCFTAAKAVRAEQRRRKCEIAASIMHDVLNHSEADAAWNRLRPFLDEAMQELKAEDREALLLRFFEAKNFSEIGRRLEVTENTARMRVERALEKLRHKLVPFGITSTAAALGGTLAGHAVGAAPAGLVSLITNAAVSSAAATGGLSLLHWLALNKAVVVSSAALITVTSVGLQREREKQAVLKTEQVALGAELQREAQLRKEVEELTRRATEVATLRQDDAELDRLKAEAAVLHTLLQALHRDTPPTKSPKPPTAQGPTFALKDLDQTPKLKQQTPPKYPIELRRGDVSGEAKVSFLVDSEGKVSEVKVLDATHKGFGYAASQAVQNWTFAPGIKDGKPVPVRMVIPMIFSLNSDNSWF